MLVVIDLHLYLMIVAGCVIHRLCKRVPMLFPTTVAIPPFTVIIKDPELGENLTEAVVPLGGSRPILCDASQNSTRIYWSSDGEDVPLQHQLLSGDKMSDSTRLQNVVAVEVSGVRTLLVFQQAVDSNSGTFECSAESLDGENASALVEVVVRSGKCNAILIACGYALFVALW